MVFCFWMISGYLTLTNPVLLFLGFFGFYQRKTSKLPRIFCPCRTHKILGRDRFGQARLKFSSDIGKFKRDCFCKQIFFSRFGPLGFGILLVILGNSEVKIEFCQAKLELSNEIEPCPFFPCFFFYSLCLFPLRGR